MTPTSYVNDAADEIDSKIGFVYSTPVDMSDPGPTSRPARLLLKRLNVFLASGRMLLAVASPGEEDQLHQYGLYLVKEATNTLDMIANGKIILDGATTIDTTQPPTVPLIDNLDSESQVEAFYDRISNPLYDTLTLRFPGG
jgi:hypothetical protein